MTHLSARLADASTTLPYNALVHLSSIRDLIDDVASDSHDRVISFGDAANPSADSFFLVRTMIGSWRSACGLMPCWQSDPRTPTLHLSAKGFDAMGGVFFRGAVQVNPSNLDITPNERSGR